MSDACEYVSCAACGTAYDCAGDTPEQRVPCPSCGAVGRSFDVSSTEKLSVRDGYGVTAKRQGEPRPYIEDRGVPSYSRSREKIVLHERIIDRENDRYFEKVSDYDTGEIIHHCEEPLSQHQGHGSAKGKKAADN